MQKKLFVVLLGAPGSGKGTQASRVIKLLNELFGIFLMHISSGDLFRDNIKRQTDLGKQVEAVLKSGTLVPDDVTIAMMRERLSRPDCQGGAILDGFPRTPVQADALLKLIEELGGTLDTVIYLHTNDDLLIQRLTGRRICKGPYQHVFHTTFNPSKAEGVCDECGSDLVQRNDDLPDTVIRRLQEFHINTDPLIEYFAKLRMLSEVDGTLDIPPITRLIADLILQTVSLNSVLV